MNQEKKVVEAKNQAIREHISTRSKELNKRLLLLTIFKILLLILTLTFAVLAISNFQDENTSIGYGLVIASLSMVSILVYLPGVNGINLKLNKIREYEEILTTTPLNQPKSNELFLRKHQVELRSYYHQAQSQSRWVFFAGLFCIAGGLIIIVITLIKVESLNSDKLLTAITGGVAGLFSETVGAIFLKMFSETTKSFNDFHERLVRTHTMHLSRLVASEIDTSDDKKFEAFSKIAENMSNSTS